MKDKETQRHHSFPYIDCLVGQDQKTKKWIARIIVFMSPDDYTDRTCPTFFLTKDEAIAETQRAADIVIASLAEKGFEVRFRMPVPRLTLVKS